MNELLFSTAVKQLQIFITINLINDIVNHN